MENTFDLRKFLIENKLTPNSKLLAEAVEVPEWLKGKLADVHSKPGQGSIFAKPIDTVMKTVQQVVDGAKNVDQVANSTGTLTVSSPGIGYNLVLPMAQALKLPGAKQGEVEKVEGPNKVKVPSVTTTAPLSQFASNELTVIVRPKKDEAGAVIPNEYIVLSAFPGNPDIPRASEWGGKFAVIIPGGVQQSLQEVDSEEAAFDSEFAQAANDIANAIGAELKSKDPKQLDESIIGGTVALVLTANAVVGFISKYSAKLFKLLNYKKGEDIAEKIHHWAHDNEKSFQAPIKRILSFFVKDPKTLELLTKSVYAIIVGSMAAGYGAAALDKLSHAEWFQGALSSLKTVAKSEEAIVNAYPAIRKLFV